MNGTCVSKQVRHMNGGKLDRKRNSWAYAREGSGKTLALLGMPISGTLNAKSAMARQNCGCAEVANRQAKVTSVFQHTQHYAAIKVTAIGNDTGHPSNAELVSIAALQLQVTFVLPRRPLLSSPCHARPSAR